MENEILDYAIVGAGVSGVYAAWRLRRQKPAPHVVVFEAGDRVGGRLLSLNPPGIPGMVAEIGGMRILPAVQPRIARLIEVLNETGSPDEQIDTFDFPVDQPENIAYLRGTHLRLSEFRTNPQKVPYHLNFLEDGKIPGEILLNAIDQIVPGITSPGLNEYQRRRMARCARFDDKPLHEQGFWQVLVRVISGEAYLLALDAGGYQSTLSNWNAADAIPWYLSDFGVEPHYKGFRHGFQQVPLTLAARFCADGGEIRLGTQLSSFTWDARENAVTLQFAAGAGGEVKARRLILAMPRRALELITEKSPLLLDEDVRKLIKSVTPRPLFKLFTTYTCPWWLPAGVKAGRTTTDLPVRQTYYWPTTDGKPADRGPAMLMASYDDGLNIGFWDGFRPRRGVGWREGAQDDPEREWFEGTLKDDTSERAMAWKQYRSPTRMVAEVQRQLGLIHGMSYTPGVVNAAFKDWGDDPFGGGWNSWNIGVMSWKVKRQIIQPHVGTPVYICGEAYSDAQGWVEGALETADIMLDRLGVPTLDDEDTEAETGDDDEGV